jgi:hypothetical protein
MTPGRLLSLRKGFRETRDLPIQTTPVAATLDSSQVGPVCIASGPPNLLDPISSSDKARPLRYET